MGDVSCCVWSGEQQDAPHWYVCMYVCTYVYVYGIGSVHLCVGAYMGVWQVEPGCVCVCGCVSL